VIDHCPRQVEAVDLVPHGHEAPRQRQQARNGRHVTLKGGVEAGDLEHARMPLATEFQHRHLGGQVLGCIVHDTPKLVDQRVITTL
jgi:hypothetical protein